MAKLETAHLTKDYGHGRGVFDVSFCVNEGEVFGFLGPNGAGKTTTIRHLMGFSKPQQGHARILGLDSFTHYAELMQHVGYLPGEVALPTGLSGIAFLQMMRALKGTTDESRMRTLLDAFELDPTGSVKRMSLGDKRKLAIVAAFLNDPDILILDEPTSGLDPLMQERFLSLIRTEKARGKTILLSSHIFREVDASCDRIAIIKDGKLIDTFLADDFKHNGTREYTVSVENQADYTALLAFPVVERQDDTLTLTIQIPTEETAKLIHVLAQCSVRSFTEKTFSLQEHFMQFYDRGKPYEHA